MGEKLWALLGAVATGALGLGYKAVEYLIGSAWQQPIETNKEQQELLEKHSGQIQEMRRRMTRHEEQISSLNDDFKMLKSTLDSSNEDLWAAINDRPTHREVGNRISRMQEDIQDIKGKMDKVLDAVLQ